MRFYTQKHHYYCGIDLHARSICLCLLDYDREIILHRNVRTEPGPFLKAIAPYRDDIAAAIECISTWHWLADLCANEGTPLVLGHALYMKAIHGGDKFLAHGASCSVGSSRYNSGVAVNLHKCLLQDTGLHQLREIKSGPGS